MFVRHLNTRGDTIKFTMECSTESIAFLDVRVRVTEGHIISTLYCKPTDSHDYLLYSSAHPQRCKDSIPYSQFLRLRRICSEEKDFEYNVLMLCTHFLRRGYPQKLLMEAAILAKQQVRADLLRPQETEEEEKAYRITTFHPSDYYVREIPHGNWMILGQSPTTSNLYNKKLMTGV